jgi:hypothetical protein
MSDDPIGRLRQAVDCLIEAHDDDPGADIEAILATTNGTPTMRATGLALLLALTVPAAAQDTPAWKRALPGAAAFLGDDGDGDDHVTVCDTPDHWRNTIVDPNHTVPGCLHLPRGLRPSSKRLSSIR